MEEVVGEEDRRGLALPRWRSVVSLHTVIAADFY